MLTLVNLVDTQVQAVKIEYIVPFLAWLDQPCRFLFPGFAYVFIPGGLAGYWNRRFFGCFICALCIDNLSFFYFLFFPLILFGPLWIIFYIIKPIRPWLDKLAAFGLSCLISTLLTCLAPSGFLYWFWD